MGGILSFFFKSIVFYFLKGKKGKPSMFALQKWEEVQKFPTKISNSGFKTLIKCVRSVFPHNYVTYKS